MNHKRQGLRAFGLSILAALGLTAFMAPGAQAGAGEWLVLATNGLKTLKESTPQLESISGEQEGTENLLQILGLNIRLYCAEVTISEAHIVQPDHTKGNLLFGSCYLTDAAGNKNTTCIVDEFSIKILGLLFKHTDGKGYILLSPQSGLTFVTPVFLDVAPEECSVTAAPIAGHVVASISAASGDHALEPLISTKNMLTLFSDELKFGTQVSHLKVDAKLKLSGVNKGQGWGYDLSGAEARWSVLGSGLESLTGRLEGAENLLQVLVLNFRIYCDSVTVSSAHIVPLGHAKATLLFSTCKLTDAAGNKNNTCIVDNITANVLGLLIKHPTKPESAGTQRWILFSPLTGLTFATLVFLDVAPEECSVTPLSITGHVVASISTASGVHAVQPLISTQATLTLFSDNLSVGVREAHLKANALAELTGANKGRAWGYHSL